MSGQDMDTLIKHACERCRDWSDDRKRKCFGRHMYYEDQVFNAAIFQANERAPGRHITDGLVERLPQAAHELVMAEERLWLAMLAQPPTQWDILAHGKRAGDSVWFTDEDKRDIWTFVVGVIVVLACTLPILWVTFHPPAPGTSNSGSYDDYYDNARRD
jgi:hypothetical protein